MTQPLTPPQADLVRAIRRDEKLANANQWVLAARPIIRAMFAIEDIDFNGLEGEQTRREARGYLSDAYRNLEAMLDGIRDDFLCDERVSWSHFMTDAEATAADELNDWLDDHTTSVRDAIKAEVEQFNASWSAAA